MRHSSKLREACLAIHYFENPDRKKEEYFYMMRALRTSLVSMFLVGGESK
jgi:hypothetical protein